jgi:hypothetical protein
VLVSTLRASSHGTIPSCCHNGFRMSAMSCSSEALPALSTHLMLCRRQPWSMQDARQFAVELMAGSPTGHHSPGDLIEKTHSICTFLCWPNCVGRWVMCSLTDCQYKHQCRLQTPYQINMVVLCVSAVMAPARCAKAFAGLICYAVSPSNPASPVAADALPNRSRLPVPFHGLVLLLPLQCHGRSDQVTHCQTPVLSAPAGTVACVHLHDHSFSSS